MSCHRFTARVSVTARQMHSSEIIMTNLRIVIEHRWRHIHSLPAAGELQKMRRRFVSQSARTEMHADPDAILLIREKIDIMISAAHGTELIAGGLFQIANRSQLPCWIVKQFVLDARFAFSADAE